MSGRFRSSPILLCTAALALFALWGCQDDRAAGTACIASSQCASKLCYANQCLDPSADDDADGLDNADEHRLGSNPQLSDSDGDGKSDRSEVGLQARAPTDTDKDGKPDLVESANADADSDCLPDEVDALDGQPTQDSQSLAQLSCSHLGVCAAGQGSIAATCKAGVLACDFSKVPGWQPAEACDGVDNDCDGQVDEGFVYQGAAIGQPCTGHGNCGVGVVICVGGLATCSSNPDGSQSQAKPELCNGEDDDCDGATDEEFSLGGLAIGAPCIAIGECGLGEVVCGPSGSAVCSSAPGGKDSHATVETCNGKDDDCDGQTDDDLLLGDLPVGATCTVAGVCGVGTVICGAQGAVVCSSAPGQAGSMASVEVCNGLDDDCDGAIDEGVLLAGQPLGGPCTGKGACGKGFVVCNSTGGVTCSTAPDGTSSQAKAETCNNVDDDCDGQTDEGLPMEWTGSTVWDDGRPPPRLDAAYAIDLQSNIFIVGGKEDGNLAARTLWRRDAATALWSRIGDAEMPAIRKAMAWWTPGPQPAGTLHCMGGLTPQDQPASAFDVDLTTGKVVMSALSAPPLAVLGGQAFVVGADVWAVAHAAASPKGEAQLLHFDGAKGTWVAPSPVPGGAVEAFSAALLDTTLYIVAATPTGGLQVHALSLPSGKWQQLPAPTVTSSLAGWAPGTVVARPQQGELWWLGGGDAGANGSAGGAGIAAMQPPWRFTVSTGQWTPLPNAAPPQVLSPVVVDTPQGLVLTAGRLGPSDANPSTWLRNSQGWQLADRQPPWSQGGVWVRVGDTMVMTTGVEPTGARAVQPPPSSWRWTFESGWNPLTLKLSLPARHHGMAVPLANGAGAVRWGGADDVPLGNPAVPLVGSVPPAVPGAEVYDPTSQTWSPAPPKLAASLPPLRAYAAQAAASPDGPWYFWTASAAGQPPQLWQWDWQNDAKLLWSGTDGPSWEAGSALSFDATHNRLLLAVSGNALQVWTWSFASQAWAMAIYQPGLSSEYAMLLGAPVDFHRLLVRTALQPGASEFALDLADPLTATWSAVDYAAPVHGLAATLVWGNQVLVSGNQTHAGNPDPALRWLNRMCAPK